MDTIHTAVEMMTPGCYMCSVDLKSAYYSVAIAPSDQKYLKFSWRGKLYQFTCFPNGLAFCPRKFTKLLKPVYSTLRNLGHLSVAYIDDSYLQADTYELCVHNVIDTLSLFHQLGFVIHPDKSVLIPTQRLTFLGFVLDSQSMTVALTGEQAVKVKEACQQLLQEKAITIREVAKVLGLLTSSLPGVLYGPLHYRSLEMDKTQALKSNQGNFDSIMALSGEAVADLQWWINSVEETSKPVKQRETQITMTADASKEGWGCSVEGTPSGGSWTHHEAQYHINYLETKAVFLALQAFSHEVSGKCVSMLVDNTTAVSCINQMGTCHSKEINSIEKGHPVTGIQTGGIPPAAQDPHAPRVPLVRELLTSQGLSASTASVILQGWRAGTRKQYASYLKRWELYCGERKIDPLSASVIQGVNFLSELYQKHQLSYSALNTARSALSPIIVPSGGGTFGSHPLVTRFLRGVFNTRPSLPRYQEIWDISIVFTYLKSLHPPEKLTLKDLTMKTTMLVASLSGQRCQTIHALDVNNMVLTKDRCTFYIQELLKTSRPGKHFGKLELRAYHPDNRLCVVTFLEEYVRRTKPLRCSSSLFISYQKPHDSVTTDTVGRWLRKVLENSGLDVRKYGAHSTRAASTSAAKTVNISIQSIMDAAGWSNAETFRKFYDKPMDTEAGSFGTELLHAIDA
ncbi:uncharacterized protein [Montipora capricornis]|uniref:uncharacterized protein n=1 Tax=Montipora capricornis TaxID=246305 RepID=UPI0035F16041